MNILTDVPDDFVVIGNDRIPVHTDFRNWIKIDNILSDKSLSAAEKIKGMLPLCYKRLPDNIGQAFKAMMEFYNPDLQREDPRKSSGRQYSFEYDAPYIYSSFFSEYGIDLQNEAIHWHKFLVLMKGLGDKCVFSRILSIRSMDISDFSGKQKQIYLRLKRIYALPDTVVEEEKVAAELGNLF